MPLPERIESIEIKNIKGINSKTFELNITPNMPSIIVAPNGFGKSSFAIGFSSITRNGIRLDKDDNYYKRDASNSPYIKITFFQDGISKVAKADKNSDIIKQSFDIYVINSSVKAKAIGNKYGKPSSRLEISDVILENSIPEKQEFKYKVSEIRNNFGHNGKILPNIEYLLKDMSFISNLSQYLDYLDFNKNKKSKMNLLVLKNL